MTGRWSVPVDITGPEARELALRELADPVYAAAQPPWWQRATTWLWDRIGSAVNEVAGAASGLVWVLVLGAVLILVAVVVARRVGWVGRRHSRSGVVFDDRVASAAEHRAAAEVAADRLDWTTATLEMFRALVRSLEERGVLDARPGQTADEAVTEAAATFSSHHRELTQAAREFDEVAYGGRAGTQSAYQRLQHLDAELAAAPMLEAPA